MSHNGSKVAPNGALRVWWMYNLHLLPRSNNTIIERLAMQTSF
jgi:hypothetical protein